MKYRTVEEAVAGLLALSTPSGDCLIAPRGPDRYARVAWGGQFPIWGHRAVVIARGEDIPPGLVVRHTCDTKGCVQSEHLVVGTYSENNQEAYDRGLQPRRASWGRRKPKRLPLRPLRLLTDPAVADMRRRAATGESFTSLAREYGVSYNGAWNAISGTTWAHVPEPPVRRRQMASP